MVFGLKRSVMASNRWLIVAGPDSLVAAAQ